MRSALPAVTAALVLAGAAFAAEPTGIRIGVNVNDGALTSDIMAPLEVFGAAAKKSKALKLEIASVSADGDRDILTEEGVRMTADFVLSDAGDFDVIIAPSAYDMQKALENEALISFLRRQGALARWMASNCSGAKLLAKAGLLDGKKATTWAGGEGMLKVRYPKVNVVFDRNVVVDEGVITSNGGVVSYQAALELLDEIAGPALAADVARDLQYSRLLNRETARASGVSPVAAFVAGAIAAAIAALFLRGLVSKRGK